MPCHFCKCHSEVDEEIPEEKMVDDTKSPLLFLTYASRMICTHPLGGVSQAMGSARLARPCRCSSTGTRGPHHRHEGSAQNPRGAVSSTSTPAVSSATARSMAHCSLLCTSESESLPSSLGASFTVEGCRGRRRSSALCH